MKAYNLFLVLFSLFLFVVISITLFIFIKQILGFTLLSLGLIMGASALAVVGLIWLLTLDGLKQISANTKRDFEQWISGGMAGVTLVLLMQLILDKKYFVFGIEPMVITILWVLGLSVLLYGGLYGLLRIVFNLVRKAKHGT